MANDKNYYDVLGVEPDADVTIIKRRYRQLVRANHPDIAPDRDSAHQKMLEINAAWTVLSDPAERARYDRGRRDPLGRGEAAGDGPIINRSPSGADEYINSAASRARAAGKTAASSAGAPRAAPRASRNATRGSSQSRTRLLTMVFEAAELYFFQGRAENAIEICERVIKADPNNAEAPALLGDIYAEQGRRDVAVQMYQTAVRNQPGNALYRQKLAALGGNVPETSRSATASRSASTPSRASTSRAPASRASSASRGAPSKAGVRSPRPAGSDTSLRGSQYRESLAQSNKSRINAGMIMLLASLLCLGIGNYALDPATFELPIVPAAHALGGGLLLFTAVGALFVGAALPLLAIAGPCSTLRPNQPRWQGWPLYVALILIGMLCFPASIAIVVLLTSVRRDFDRSWLVVVLAALAWSCTLALRVEDSEVPATLVNAFLWWSGRLIYPPLALGWALGSSAVRR